MAEIHADRAAEAEPETRGGATHGTENGGEHGHDEVEITVNDKLVMIRRGRQAVSEVKRLGGVPAADELAQVVEGEPLKPLPDDGSVVIKGGEEFMSYPKDSGSSYTGPGE